MKTPTTTRPLPVWPALLLAPLVALADLTLAYALATPACASQRATLLHALPAVCLLVTLGCTAPAWIEAGRHRPAQAGDATSPGVDADAAARRARLIARIAVWCGTFSSLVVVALWIPLWLLSPCVS